MRTKSINENPDRHNINGALREALVNKVVLSSITLHSRNEIGTWHLAAAERA
jgi:hypothetical protein